MPSKRPFTARPGHPRPHAVRSLAGTFTATFRLGVCAIAVLVLVTTGMYAVVVVHYEALRSRLGAGDRNVRIAHQAMVDQETGLRAYLLTGDRRFLEPYDQGRTQLARSAQAIVDQLGSVRGMTPLLLRMRVAERLWTDEWATAAASGRAGSGVDPGQVDFLLRGKQLFDEYRASESAVLDRVASLRADTVATERMLLVGGLLIQLFVCALTGTFGYRRYRRLRQQVVGPVEGMLGAMHHAASGHLAPVLELDVDGPAELRELGYGLVEMTAALSHERAMSEERAQENVRQAAKLRLILELAREIAGSLSLRYVLQSVGRSAIDVSGWPRAVVWLLDDELSALQPVHDTAHAPGTIPPADVPVGDGLVGRAARYGRTFAGVDVHSGHGTDVAVASALLAIPLVVGARVVGVLALVSDGDDPLPAEIVEVLETMAAHAASAIEAARLHGRTQELAQIDPLTRLPNRRQLDTDLALEMDRCRRQQRPLSFLMLDVDHFKQCNDEHGHQAGDEVLQQVAATLAGEVRGTDTVYRYGGEEFAVLLRDTPSEGAAELANRLRLSVAGRVFGHDRIHVTISLGVAVAPADGLDVAGLVAAADERLFVAKRQGRNQVITTERALVAQP